MCKSGLKPNLDAMKLSKSPSLQGKDSQEEKKSMMQFSFRIPVNGCGYKFVTVTCNPLTTTLKQLKERLVHISDVTVPLHRNVVCVSNSLHGIEFERDTKNDACIEELLQHNNKNVVQENLKIQSEQRKIGQNTEKPTYKRINETLQGTRLLLSAFYGEGNLVSSLQKPKLKSEDIYLTVGSKSLHDNDSSLHGLLSVTSTNSSVYPITINVGIKQRGGCFLVSATIALILFSAILLAPLTCGTSLCVFPFLFPLLFVLPLCLL